MSVITGISPNELLVTPIEIFWEMERLIHKNLRQRQGDVEVIP